MAKLSRRGSDILASRKLIVSSDLLGGTTLADVQKSVEFVAHTFLQVNRLTQAILIIAHALLDRNAQPNFGDRKQVQCLQ